MKPDYPELRDLLLAMAEERQVDRLLACITRQLCRHPDVALARIWRIAPGDRCASCPLAAECPGHVPCLHLAASAGTPHTPGADWSRIDGDFQRFPIGVRKIGRIATGEALCVEEIEDDSQWIARPEWARREGIRGFGGTPLVHRDEVLGVFIEHTWTRLPVYSETLDQPLGLVHFKDFALKYGFGRSDDAFEMKGLIRPLLYVPPSMPIGVLLHKMQIARIHMALVIDEYGGVDGLVTIEDLLEQIVGDIADEHDEDESGIWIVEGPDVYVAAARMDLEDFETETGVQISLPNRDEEPDTLGGLVFRIAGRVPERGEIVIHEDGHEFEILDADARRIKRLRVRLKRHRDDDPLAEAAE